MADALEVKWPWEMIWMESADEFIAQIKDSLPPDHDLQEHDIFPGLKWDGRPIFIVDDDTTGKRILMNFEQPRRWEETRYNLPRLTIFDSDAAVAAQIAPDHIAECAKYRQEEVQGVRRSLRGGGASDLTPGRAGRRRTRRRPGFSSRPADRRPPGSSAGRGPHR